MMGNFRNLEGTGKRHIQKYYTMHYASLHYHYIDS